MSDPKCGQPEISVILPVLNGARTLETTLRALRNSRFEDFEILVVDDGSMDGTDELLLRYGVDRVIRNAEPQGPFACRNQGADAAGAGILFYTDADVEIAPDTLDKVARHFREHQGTALIGLYGMRHPHRNPASVYKNSWIHYTYRQIAPRADWFFTAVGAVRKSDWERAGRFDPGFRIVTGGGDIEFGHRLLSHGVEVVLDPSLEVIHHKRYSLGALLRNDLLRAYGYSLLALRIAPGKASVKRLRIANVPSTFAMATALAGLMLLIWPASLAVPLLVWPAIASLLAYLAANARFLNHVRKALSLKTSLAMVPILFLDHVAAGLGVLAAICRRCLPGSAGPGLTKTERP